MLKSISDKITLITLLLSTISFLFYLLCISNNTELYPYISLVFFFVFFISFIFRYIYNNNLKNKLSDKEISYINQHCTFLEAISEPLIVISEKSNKCCFANKHFYNITNFKKEEVIGSDIGSFLKIKTKIKNKNIEQTLKTKNGKEISILISWDNITINKYKYNIMHITDISIIDHIEKNQDDILNIKKIIGFQKARVGIVIIDASLNVIVEINEMACKILEKNREDLIDKHCNNTICNLSKKECEQLQKNEKSVQKEEFIIKNNTKKNLLRTSNRIKIGKYDYIIDTLIDVSLIKKIEEKIKKRQKLESIETLTYGIAHEFNNINAVIEGIISMSLMSEDKDNPIPEIIKSNLKKIKHMKERETKIIKELMIFGSHPKKTKSIISFNNAINKIIQKPKFNDICFKIDANNDFLLNIHPNDFILSMENIIDNAAESMINKNNKKIEIQTIKEEDLLIISIKDYGCGIFNQNIHKVFDPLYSTKGVYAKSGTSQSEINGKGLGLSICQIIIEKHNKGNIEIQSEVNKGTNVIISLPYVKENKIYGYPINKTKNKKCIFIMNNELEKKSYKLLLNKIGFKTDEYKEKEIDLINLNNEKENIFIIDNNELLNRLSNVNVICFNNNDLEDKNNIKFIKKDLDLTNILWKINEL